MKVERREHMTNEELLSEVFVCLREMMIRGYRLSFLTDILVGVMTDCKSAVDLNMEHNKDMATIGTPLTKYLDKCILTARMASQGMKVHEEEIEGKTGGWNKL